MLPPPRPPPRCGFPSLDNFSALTSRALSGGEAGSSHFRHVGQRGGVRGSAEVPQWWRLGGKVAIERVQEDAEPPQGAPIFHYKKSKIQS